MKIGIRSVPQKQIRNNGVGDYRKIKGGLQISVAKTGDKDFQKGVAIHEFVESLLAQKRKIPFGKIDRWDRKNIKKKGEPGEMKGAPYFKEHAVANRVEKILIKELKRKK